MFDMKVLLVFAILSVTSFAPFVSGGAMRIQDIACKTAGYFGFPGDCTRFYRCVDYFGSSQRFSLFVFDCPPETVFDDTLSVCNHPEWISSNATCNGDDNGDSGSEESAESGEMVTKPTIPVTITPVPVIPEPVTNVPVIPEPVTNVPDIPEAVSAVTGAVTTVVPQEMTTVPVIPEVVTTIPVVPQEIPTTPATPATSTIPEEMTTAVPVIPEATTSVPVIPETTTSVPVIPEATTSVPVIPDEVTTIAEYVTTIPESLTSIEPESGSGEYGSGESTESTESAEMTSPVPLVTETPQFSTSPDEMTSPLSVTPPSSSSSSSQFVILCGDSLFHRHPLQCDLFYHCVWNGLTFDINVLACESGLVFDEPSSSCMLPDQTDQCQLLTAIDPVVVTTPSVPVQYTLSADSLYNCTAPGHFPYELDCIRFYRCFEIYPNILKGLLYRCPEGYEFSSVTERCEMQSSLSVCDRVGLRNNQRLTVPFYPLENTPIVRIVDFKQFFANPNYFYQPGRQYRS